MSRKYSRLLAPVIISAIVISSVSIAGWWTYLAYLGEITPAVATAAATLASVIGTLTLVGITGWYAFSTWKLLEATQTQTKAIRAGYAPNLDLDYKVGSDFVGENGMDVDIVNRGEGVATNIRIVAVVDVEWQQGVSEYRYTGTVPTSLRPEQTLVDHPDAPTKRPLYLTMKFYYEEGDVRHEVTYSELLEKLDGREIVGSPELEIQLLYTDVAENNLYKESIVDKQSIDTSKDGIDASLSHSTYGGTLTVLPATLWGRVKWRIKEIIGSIREESKPVYVVPSYSESVESVAVDI